LLLKASALYHIVSPAFSLFLFVLKTKRNKKFKAEQCFRPQCHRTTPLFGRANAPCFE
jgi:hypothetical protein